jgi:DNA-binding NarL/FixJ family response regulator
MPHDKIRVVIVDDHPGVRAGIKKLLRRAKDITVVGEGADGMKAIELAGSKKPDILLLDVELPVLGGDIVMRRIHDSEPNVRVLVVSTYNDRTYIESMVANGAAGYITKDEAPAMLLDAIYRILDEGDLWMSPKALENAPTAGLEEQMLTDREVQILQNLVLNRSESEIAEAMHMENQQVGSYLHVLMDKFEADTLDTLRALARSILRHDTPKNPTSGNSEYYLL